jgi:hypothetical protein
MRKIYNDIGVENFYMNLQEYHNPHSVYFEAVLRITLDKILKEKKLPVKVLDMCTGAGEITGALQNINKSLIVSASDPYTGDMYKKKFECNVFQKCSFLDIANGKLEGVYDIIICSFALHLCKKDLLYSLMYQISTQCNFFVILSPTKKPIIDKFPVHFQFTLHRIHVRIYTVFNKI